eukprot:6211779-Pleurochrysis_carterae.AAC.2
MDTAALQRQSSVFQRHAAQNTSVVVEMLQEQLAAANAKIAMWERCMQQMMNCVMLSPDMNDMYKEECAALIQQALSSLEQIEQVHFVECSFPSISAEVPLALDALNATRPMATLLIQTLHELLRNVHVVRLARVV